MHDLNVLLNFPNYIIKLFDIHIDISCLLFAPVLRSLYVSDPNKH